MISSKATSLLCFTRFHGDLVITFIMTSAEQLFLLLIPIPFPSISPESLRSQYGPSLSQALQKTSRFSSQSAASILDIALVHEDYHPSNTVGDTPYSYSKVQRLIALTYRLTITICAEESIDLRYDNDVNVSVIFFRNRTRKDVESFQAVRNSEVSLGHFQALASRQRPWKCIYYLENEAGRTLFESFLHIRNGLHDHTYEHLASEGVGGAAIPETTNLQSLSEASRPEHFPKCHYSVAVGGTFDHLHIGHKLLLTMTASLVVSGVISANAPQRAITIGITGDKLLQNKKFVNELQDWYARQAGVERFLLGILEMLLPYEILKSNPTISYVDSGARMVRNEFESGLVINYVEIFDPFGPTIIEESISALVISRETRAGGKAVNQKRQEKGWSLLEVFEVDVLDAEDGNDSPSQEYEDFKGKISSTDIRRRLHERSTAT